MANPTPDFQTEPTSVTTASIPIPIPVPVPVPGLDPIPSTTTTTTTTETTRTQFDALEDDDRVKVELFAEELAVQKGVRQMGEVTFSKRIVEEHVNVPVTLRREEVTMTRRDIAAPSDPNTAPDDAVSATDAEAFQEQTIVIRLYEEVPHITKTTRVSGEVEISKRVVSRDKNLLNTVRREEIDVDAPQNITVIDADKTT